MPRVIIDQQEVEVTPGSNLLAAARKLGLDIPALCYHPACPPGTGCMACVMRRVDDGRIVPSCATPAEDGLQVESETDEVRALRRTALELLLSDHADTASADCHYPTCDCDARSHCRLRKYAQVYEADPTRFAGPQRAAPARGYHHEAIAYDPSKCILCGICVQLARQAGEPLGLTFVGRGFEMQMTVPFGGPLAEALTTCALLCAGACPTGALLRRPGPPGPEQADEQA